ncbi:acyltransferase family protein [Aestuariibaculum lutulentum]|uniref:Heparan-alpha-glucosaminide N-acetyltransferase domain-containing protein n=1 Tax=Aestuariibaculum lutulentum TaxID=2920935 RepID=A0ABS9RG62_9FLAO|nr:heparan-alpha-glucosaminide N-acetyltransferase domain-containing protein [Aestuariibaculum lutulentum]MCH4551942.1 heparan-alpha-glucosaminide N-acetyltransferase domain-containing protein [Aestuariibaculum lutulentum]
MSASQRIQSVDLLRGVTIVAMILVNNPGTWSSVYAPLLHAEWHGLTPTDLVFPFFLFIVGISIYYAYKNKKGNIQTYKKIGIRSLKLIALGLFLRAFMPTFPFIQSWESFRFMGVLQRIGIVFFITAVLYLNYNWKVLLGIALGILLSYWLLLGFVPLPNGMAPSFDKVANNWSMYIDSIVLGGHMWKPDYDPEGILGTVSAIATCLLGVLIGKVLDKPIERKASILVAIGLLFLVVGYVFSLWFPINKALWSSSFVLVTAGYATVILAIIYYIVDVKHWHFGRVFKKVGMNAITIYFLSGFIAKSFYLIPVGEHSNIHSWLYSTFFQYDFLEAKLASLCYALVVVLFYLALGNYLYKKGIFIKV